MNKGRVLRKENKEKERERKRGDGGKHTYQRVSEDGEHQIKEK